MEDFTCKELIFLLSGDLKILIWILVIGKLVELAVLVWAYCKLRGDNAALHSAIRGGRAE